MLVIGFCTALPAAAGGRTDSSVRPLNSGFESRQSAPSADQPSEVSYWSHLARKRLNLWRADNRRMYRKIVRLVVRLRRLVPRHEQRRTQPGGVRGAICTTFGSHCSEALNVAECESHFNVYARNGQYLGLFQMGSFARAKYGHGWDAWTQSRAAYRYFLDAGWSPWQCRP